jgi:hypothetical protein
MSTQKPDWLPGVRKFCRDAGIAISGWGPDTLVVEAKSPELARVISNRLRPLGLAPVASEDDAAAGLLLLSRTATTRLNAAAAPSLADLARRPTVERLGPLLEAVFATWLFWYGARQPLRVSWYYSAGATIALIVFLWDFSRTWGWRVQFGGEDLRIRRYFLWRAIPWGQVRAVEFGTVRSRGAVRSSVVLKLAANRTFRLGVFAVPYAHALRDGLRRELASRQMRGQTPDVSRSPMMRGQAP